jgi:O-antigen ligase
VTQEPWPGDRWLVVLVAVLPVLAATSLLWTIDLPETIQSTVSYGEALVAFVFAVQQTDGLPVDRIVRMLRRFLYVLLLPAVLMLTHVPGFAPQTPGLSPTSGDYLSYFSRLSHPFMGRSNNLATVLLLLSIVLVHRAITHRDRATSVAALVCTVAVVLTLSRGALLALAAAAVFSLLFRRRPERGVRRRAAFATAGFCVVVTAVGWLLYVVYPPVQEFIGGRFSDANLLSRESRFTDGLGYLLQRPLWGYGAGALPARDPTIAGGVHNTYLQQLLAYGVVLGFLAVLSLVGLAHHFLRGRSDGMRRAVGLTLVALLVNLSVESSFEGAALRVVIFLLLGMLVGLVRAAEEPVPSEPVVGRHRLVA